MPESKVLYAGGQIVWADGSPSPEPPVEVEPPPTIGVLYAGGQVVWSDGSPPPVPPIETEPPPTIGVLYAAVQVVWAPVSLGPKQLSAREKFSGSSIIQDAIKTSNSGISFTAFDPSEDI